MLILPPKSRDQRGCKASYRQQSLTRAHFLYYFLALFLSHEALNTSLVWKSLTHCSFAYFVSCKFWNLEPKHTHKHTYIHTGGKQKTIGLTKKCNYDMNTTKLSLPACCTPSIKIVFWCAKLGFVFGDGKATRTTRDVFIFHGSISARLRIFFFLSVPCLFNGQRSGTKHTVVGRLWPVFFFCCVFLLLFWIVFFFSSGPQAESSFVRK